MLVGIKIEHITIIPSEKLPALGGSAYGIKPKPTKQTKISSETTKIIGISIETRMFSRQDNSSRFPTITTNPTTKITRLAAVRFARTAAKQIENYLVAC